MVRAWLRVVITGVVLLVGPALYWLVGLNFGLFGNLHPKGQPTVAPIEEGFIAQRDALQDDARLRAGSDNETMILFGDLHVHTTYSIDAYAGALRFRGGSGLRPVADACDYARFCAALDFWAITDHAETLTTRTWHDTQDAIEQCMAAQISPGGGDELETVPFLGWEWTGVSRESATHYGHRNIILKDASKNVPQRAIASPGSSGTARGVPPLAARMIPTLGDWGNRQGYYDFYRHLQEIAERPLCPEGVPSPDLPDSCHEVAWDPADLFRKLDEWPETEAIVIPHGTTWGFYTPPDSDWVEKQGAYSSQHDLSRQILFETYSGHGNSEEYRPFIAIIPEDDGTYSCPGIQGNYVPMCVRAGEIIQERCEKAGGSPPECADRAADARKFAANMGIGAWMSVPSGTVDEWRDAGQCMDCYLPSFNYNPKGSIQYVLARRDFSANPAAKHVFGFIGSSDNHTARPGAGYKERNRPTTLDGVYFVNDFWKQYQMGRQPEPSAAARYVDILTPGIGGGFRLQETERLNSYFYGAGLVGVHATERSSDAIWDAMSSRSTYATSGGRLMLWFDLLNGPGNRESWPMGSHVEMNWAPSFRVRAIGEAKQAPGCPDYRVNAVDPQRLEHLCKSDCYNPTNERHSINKIQVVRIRPQLSEDEPVEDLIEDPWLEFVCPPNDGTCVVQFTDPEFFDSERDSLYYVRAIQEATPVMGGEQIRCERDDSGRCVRVLDPCPGIIMSDGFVRDCNDGKPVGERAWSSPIYVDFAPWVGRSRDFDRVTKR